MKILKSAEHQGRPDEANEKTKKVCHFRVIGEVIKVCSVFVNTKTILNIRFFRVVFGQVGKLMFSVHHSILCQRSDGAIVGLCTSFHNNM